MSSTQIHGGELEEGGVDEFDLENIDFVCAFFNISAATAYRNVKAGIISPPIKVGRNINRWTRRQLRADKAKMIAASSRQVA